LNQETERIKSEIWDKVAYWHGSWERTRNAFKYPDYIGDLCYATATVQELTEELSEHGKLYNTSYRHILSVLEGISHDTTYSAETRSMNRSGFSGGSVM
jgi:hypothetical protein